MNAATHSREQKFEPRMLFIRQTVAGHAVSHCQQGGDGFFGMSCVAMNFSQHSFEQK